MEPCHGSMTTPGAVIVDRSWTHLCASLWHQRTLCWAPSKVKMPTNNTSTGVFLLRVQLLPVWTNFPRPRTRSRIVRGISPVPLSVQMVEKCPRHCSCLPFPVCVLNLQASGDAVTDSNPHLASCCQLLELLLRKGLQRQSHTPQIPNLTFQHFCVYLWEVIKGYRIDGRACACVRLCSPEPVLSLVHRDYWQCFEQLTHQDACGRYRCFLDVHYYLSLNKLYRL